MKIRLTCPLFSQMLTFMILIISLSGFKSNSPDFKEDINKINEAYEKNSDFSMNILYNYYDNFTTQTVNKSEKAVLQKSGISQLYKIAQLEMLTNEKYYVVVNSEQKMIMVSAAPKKQQRNYLPVAFDTTMAKLGQVEAFTPANGLNGYKISMKYGDYEQVEIQFDPGTHFIKKMVLYQRKAVSLNNEGDENAKKEKPRLEIIFSDIKLNPGFDKNNFSESKYLKITTKDIACQPRYTDYKIVNSLKLTSSKNK